MKTKYEKVCIIAFALMTAAEARTGKGALAKAMALLMTDGYGSQLRTIIESYLYTPAGQDDKIDCPPDIMATDFCDYIYSGAPKPEWLKHASL